MHVINSFYFGHLIPNAAKQLLALVLFFIGVLGLFFHNSSAFAAEPPSQDGDALFGLNGENLNAKIQKLDLDFDMTSFVDEDIKNHLIKATATYQIEVEEATDIEVFTNAFRMQNGSIQVNGQRLAGINNQADLVHNWLERSPDKQDKPLYNDGFTTSTWGNYFTLSLPKGTSIVKVEYWAEPFILFDTGEITSKYYLSYFLTPLRQWDAVSNITISITPPPGWSSTNFLDGKTHAGKWTLALSELPSEDLQVELSPPVPNTSFEHVWAIALIAFVLFLASVTGRVFAAHKDASSRLDKLIIVSFAGVFAAFFAVIFVYGCIILDIYQLDQYTANGRSSLILMLVLFNMTPFVLIASFIGFLLTFFSWKRKARQGKSTAALLT